MATHQSLLGTHVWYRQTFHGLPVLDSYYARHFTKDGHLKTVSDGRRAVPASLSTTPTVSAPTATNRAATAVTARATAAAKAAVARPAKATTFVPAFGTANTRLAVVGGTSPALVWDVVSDSTSGETETVVDAHSGATRAVRVLSKNATGEGYVFDPNPVVALHDESLTDQGDRNQAALNPAYKRVPLLNLKAGPTLVGKYAAVIAARGGLASNAKHTYLYTRQDDRFEQVNAYYGVNKAQTYIQSLGFVDVNDEAQALSIDTYAGDNSFYSPHNDVITYGVGGVDDAEDLEVVWHEYGHAIQDAQVPGYGSSEEAGATGEGFGDYWAVTMSEATSRGFDLPCVADWDSTSYTPGPVHCLRRTDTGKTVADIDGEVHDDGEIWSNALWDINLALGQRKANTTILEAQFAFTPDNSFAQAADQTVAAAQGLYGAAAAAKVRQAFVARGILAA